MGLYEDGFQAGRETQWASKEAGLRRAVIEAARAYERAQTPTTSGAVCKAVRALDAAEKGGDR